MPSPTEGSDDRPGRLSRRAAALAALPPAVELTLGGGRRTLVLIGLGAVAFVLGMFRLTPGSWNTLWAEDGTIFVQSALHGDPGVVLEPYAGYLNVLPRLEAGVAALFPLPAIPTVVTVLAALTMACVSVALFVLAGHRVRSPWLRLAIWGSFVAAPVASSEVADTLANLHWYLLIVEFWALVVLARSRAVVVVQCLVIAAAVTCDPLAIIALPLVVARIVLCGRRDLPIAIVFVAASAVQLVGIAAAQSVHQRDVTFTLPGAGRVIDFYGTEVATPMLFGVRITSRLATSLPETLGGIVLAGIAAVLVVGALRSRRQRIGMLTLAGSSAVLMGTTLALQWDWIVAPPPYQFVFNARYILAPIALLFSAVAVALDGILSSTRHPRPVSVLVILFAVWTGIVAASDYRAFEPRQASPDWNHELDVAAANCGRGREQRVDIVPGGWTVAISCDRLKRDRPAETTGPAQRSSGSGRSTPVPH
jgi:hypothetical protein